MRFALSLLLTALLQAVALAQSSSPATPAPAASPSLITISGWRLECSSATTGDLVCQALNRVSVRATNAVVGALSIRLGGDKKTPMLYVQVPLGIAIPNNVRVGTPNGVVQTVKILTCTRDGCFGNMPLGDPLLTVMRAAKVPLQMAYDSIAADSTTRTVTISIGLSGFPETYAKLR
jgi:invasion protein IalB